MTRARTNADQARTESVESIPHIIPGVLYPAVAGKLLDGSTSHGATYGVAQSDGRSYYYTDIKGSKPIKDPRIGGHFGSQRHKAKSVQLLEQETATHGENVYSVDGREWFRVVSSDIASWNMDVGNFIGSSNHTFTTFFEIVGYFNDFNCISRTKNDRADDINVTVNGGTTRNSANTDKLAGRSTVDTPLGGRYVDVGSVINHGDSDVTSDLGTTPRINTIKIEAINTGSEYWQFFGIELIAQDTSSTANRSKIQIPSQNVVSYGKKFTVSGTPHYDPFNGFTSGNLAAVQALIDTDTSLGMANWLSSSTYYRPFNGGRVVKWVDSSGNIKTSVTMMPPNAQNIAGSASNAHTLGNANDQTINFDTTTIANATPLSEVAKTFHYREFGNGAANGGASGTWADASMFTHGSDDIAYVMDDGLTSFSGQDVRENGQLYHHDTTGIFLTWIGTGLSYHSNTGFAAPNATWAQNLPYGTHVLKIEAYAAYGGTNGEDHKLTLDGVVIADPLTVTHADSAVPYLGHPEFTFHQPKMPPVPEDAVIISDYMLMADFVADSAGAIESISKGTRFLGASRDIFLDENTNQTYPLTHQPGNTNQGIHIEGAGGAISSGTLQISATYFGKEVCWKLYGTQYGTLSEHINSTTITDTALSTSAWGGKRKVTGQTLGINGIKNTQTSGDFGFNGVEIATPIHTSSHYQTFETPFLHELVGGDRNMEQHNLIVTPDGKTWDEVTRDTSYIGNVLVTTNWASQNNTNTTVGVGDEFRGREDAKNLFVKDFAIAYDRLICLVDGHYQIIMGNHQNSDSGAHYSQIRINGTPVRQVYYEGTGNNFIHAQLSFPLKRGDYVDHKGMHFTDETFQFQINRLS